MQLDRPLTWTAAVQPVKLPAQGGDVPAGTEVIVSGWGATTVSAYTYFFESTISLISNCVIKMQEGGAISDTLKAVNLTIIEDSVCQRSYLTNTIAPSMVCANDADGKILIYKKKTYN